MAEVGRIVYESSRRDVPLSLLQDVCRAAGLSPSDVSGFCAGGNGEVTFYITRFISSEADHG